MIFDGKAFAKEIEQEVIDKVRNLARPPKIVSVLVGEDPASVLYTRLKKEAAERVGIEFVVEKLRAGEDVKAAIERVGPTADGIMVQMPIPGLSREEQGEVINAIPLAKDVDGLRWEESGVMPATVRAIISILEKIDRQNIWSKKFVVVGTHGSVGKPLSHFLRERGVNNIKEVNSQTEDPTMVIREGEVVISCVGKAGLVREIKAGAVAVDVGISMVDGKTVGDMTRSVYNVASVAVAVPGGVGPVTVASLMENAVGLYGGKRSIGKLVSS